jgi:MFS family permease
VRTLLLFEAVTSLVGDDSTMLTLFAATVLQIGPDGLGLLMSSLGAGALIGSLLLALIGTVRSYGRLLLLSSTIYALSLGLFAFSRTQLMAMALLVVMGAAGVIWAAMRSAALQLIAPEHLRGRVMALVSLATRGLGPLGQTESGVVASLWGAPAIPLLGGAVVLGLNFWCLLRVPSVLRFRAVSAAASSGAKATGVTSG